MAFRRFPSEDELAGMSSALRSYYRGRNTKRQSEKRAREREWYKNNISNSPERRRLRGDRLRARYATDSSYRDKVKSASKSRYKNRVAKTRGLDRLADPVTFIAREWMVSCRARAKKKGLEFNLTHDFLVEKLSAMRCEATGLKLSPNLFPGKRNPMSPSLDRIDNAKGYTMDNVMVTCLHFNLAKHQFSLEDLLVLATALADRHGLVR